MVSSCVTPAGDKVSAGKTIVRGRGHAAKSNLLISSPIGGFRFCLLLKTANGALNTPPPASGGRRFFGIRSVLVAAGLAVLDEEHDEDNKADDRKEADQHPPATAPGVMQSPDGQREAWDEYGEAVERAEGSVAALSGEAENIIDDIGQNNGDDVEQHEHPVGLAA